MCGGRIMPVASVLRFAVAACSGAGTERGRKAPASARLPHSIQTRAMAGTDRLLLQSCCSQLPEQPPGLRHTHTQAWAVLQQPLFRVQLPNMGHRATLPFL